MLRLSLADELNLNNLKLDDAESDGLTLLQVAQLYMLHKPFMKMFDMMSNGFHPPIRYIHFAARKIIKIKSFSIKMVGPLVFGKILDENDVCHKTSVILACHVLTGEMTDQWFKDVNLITQTGVVYYGSGKTDAESTDIILNWLFLIKNKVLCSIF